MKRTWIVTPAIIVLLAAASYGLFLYLSPPQLPQGFLYGNGHIEGTEVRIASEVTGRILESRLVEGKSISAGDLLVQVDDTDLQIQFKQIQAEKAALDQQRSRLESELGPARHHLSTAQTDYARYRDLKASGTETAQRLDEAANAVEQALSNVKSLEGQVSVTDSLLDAASQRISLVQSQLGKTEIKAPITGTILVKAVETGEFVTPGKVVAVLVNLQSLELKVFVPEADLGKVKLETQARVKTSAFQDRFYDAHVARVDQQAQFTPRDIHLPEERVRMVFGVTLELANLTGELKPGMPADAWIRWKEDVPWPGKLVVPR